MIYDGAIRMTKEIFNLQDKNEWDFLTLAGIAMCHFPTKVIEKEKIHFSRLNAETIAYQMGLKNGRNNRRYVEKIDRSLDKLIEHKVIKAEKTKYNLYQGVQVVNFNTANSGYLTLFLGDIYTMVDNLAANELAKAVACYTVISRGMSINLASQVEFDKMTPGQLRKYYSFESAESISRRYGKERRSTMDTIAKLEEINVLSTRKVTKKTENNYKSKRYYTLSRFSEVISLAMPNTTNIV